MDEDILEDMVGVEVIGTDDGDGIKIDQDNSQNAVVSGGDSVPDSSSGFGVQGDSGGDGVAPGTGGDTSGIGSDSWLTIYDDELGGIPVVIVDSPSAYSAVGTQNGYQMSTYYVDYFAGVLENLHDTEYLAFCTRENVNGSSYVEHNRLVYDITVAGDQAQTGTYPCVDIYRSNGSSTYSVSHTTYNLQVVPSFSYGSFGIFSDLRKGVGHSEIYAVLLFLGFFAVYTVCHDIFDYVMEHVYRK